MPPGRKDLPDGRTWYAADMHTPGIWILNGDAFTQPRFLAAGAGAHGLYVSRVQVPVHHQPGEGSISLLNFATRKLVAKWRISGGGIPTWAGCPPTAR